MRSRVLCVGLLFALSCTRPTGTVGVESGAPAQQGFLTGSAVEVLFGAQWLAATVIGNDPAGTVHVEIRGPSDTLRVHVRLERVRRTGRVTAVLDRPFRWTDDPGGLAVLPTTPLLRDQPCVVQRSLQWFNAHVRELHLDGRVTVSIDGFTQWNVTVDRARLRIGTLLR